MEEDKVLFKIRSLDKIIMRKFLTCNNNFECDIHISRPTPTQMEIIEYILDHIDEEIYQKDLEEVLKLRRATVSGVLQTMEKNQLIVRSTCPDDTRVKKIVLNEKTKEIFSNNMKNMRRLGKIAVKDIDKNELDIFFKVINKIKSNIENSDTVQY